MVTSWKARTFWQVTIPTVLDSLKLWYSRKKWQLRAKRPGETEFHLRPFVVLEATSEGGRQGLQLRNIGNGSAVDIQVREVKVPLSASRLGVIRFPTPLSVLRAGETRRLQYTAAYADRGEPADDDTDANDILQILLPKENKAVQVQQLPSEIVPEITILFHNVEGAPYFVIECLVHGHLEILDSGRW